MGFEVLNSINWNCVLIKILGDIVRLFDVINLLLGFVEK